MSSSKFYIIFNIFNILLIGFIILCMNISMDLTFDIQGSSGSDIRFLWGSALYITYIIVKLYLPKLLVNIAKKHTKSIISEFIQFIKNTPQHKKKILIIAFCYDLPFLIYCIYIYIDYFFIWTVIFTLIAYILFYAGGILLFYLMLYRGIKKYLK